MSRQDSSEMRSPQRRTRAPECGTVEGIPLLQTSLSASSSSSSSSSQLKQPSSSMQASGRPKSQSYSNGRSHHSSAMTKCLLCLLLITVMPVTLLWTVTVGLEDLSCPLKKWTYPTCLPRANEILQHIPTEAEWVSYRAAFKRAVLKPEHFSLEPAGLTDGSRTGFKVPVRVEYSEERGRGVYAAAFIPKETMVWDNRYTARIRNECEGKRFVQELTNDQACNVIIWGYATDHGTGKLEWGVDLDPATFMNEGKTPAQINVEDRLVDPSMALLPGGHSAWSTRDIEEGEELLSSYEGLRDINPNKNLFWQAKGVFMAWGLGPFLF